MVGKGAEAEAGGERGCAASAACRSLPHMAVVVRERIRGAAQPAPHAQSWEMGDNFHTFIKIKLLQM